MVLNETHHLLLQGFFNVGTQRKDHNWSALAIRLSWGVRNLRATPRSYRLRSQSIITCWGVCKMEDSEWQIESARNPMAM